jgi:translocation and assembly module TamA
VNLEWEHRNFRGLGETLNLKTNLWNNLQSASLLYLKPNVFLEGQNLISKGEVLREVTDGFTEYSWGVSSVLERQWSEKTQFSYGLAFKQVHDTRSDNNRHFNLFKTPIKVYYNNTNNLLDPTVGKTALLKVTPTLQVLSPQFAYCITQLNTTQYIPLNESITLAGKLSLGSIWGASRKGIPPSERLYAGTESLLRGYRYMSVSPLNHKHKPIGGRSLVVGSLELRTKISENIGLVGFYEAGNVYSTPYPNFKEKILQSVGLGIRYHTPVGPLRCDVGIPLNPRKHVDNGCEIYFSIGQSF